MADISSLPPRDQWVVTDTSIARWRAAFDFLQVLALEGGRRCLIVELSGRRVEIELEPELARHLAAQLA